MVRRIAILSTLACLAAFTVLGGAARAGCELDRPVVFAGLDWDSAAFHNALARRIIEAGYGCDTEAIPGSTLVLVTGLARGDIDVAMEIWKDNVTEPWTKALEAGKVLDIGTNFPDAVQGWWVPRYVVEGDAGRGIAPVAPGLKRVRDLPRYKELFRDPEEPGKGRFYNCILGWNCELVNTYKLEAYGLLEHFTNFRPGSGAALAAAIASHYKRGKPVVAYYWGPTWVLGAFDLVKLEEAPYDPDAWRRFVESKGAAGKPVAYPRVEVVVGVNAEFARAAPRLVDFLASYETSNAVVSRALAYMQEGKGRTAADAALHFLRTQEDLWTRWVPVDVAARVKASLR